METTTLKKKKCQLLPPTMKMVTTSTLFNLNLKTEMKNALSLPLTRKRWGMMSTILYEPAKKQQFISNLLLIFIL